ncbi:hypothetical protein [Aquipuribacter hungaricus]|uniref:Secreted protein n=1 Tax=Aquipuribacter hungaricus TaxID=545624 RepID=A0ABV7WJ39_9MICO
MTPTRHRPHRTAAPLLLLALALSGCGGDAGDGPATGAGATAAAGATGDAAAACLEGSVGCDDTPGATGTGGVESGADGSVPVGEAVAGGVQGPFLMSGYLVAVGGDVRLCEALAESSPPQCGGTSVPLEPAQPPAGATTTTQGDVTWSDAPVAVEGELVDGVFVVRTA